MSTIIKTGMLSIFLMISAYCANSQSLTFSQYMNNLTPINQAYSTMESDTKVNVSGRKQFIGIDASPSSFLLNGSLPLLKIGSSVGMVLQYDKIGVENHTGINLFFAKKIQLAKATFFSVSLSGGFSNHLINYSSLDTQDPEFSRNDVRQTLPEIGVGLMVYNNRAYIGVSVPQLSLKRGQNFTGTYYMVAGYLAPLGEDFKIKPAALLAYAGSEDPLALDVSTTLYIKDFIGLGVNYRNKQSVSGILTLLMKKNIQLGYSYSLSTGKFAGNGLNNATQEISIGYRFGKGISAPRLL